MSLIQIHIFLPCCCFKKALFDTSFLKQCIGKFFVLQLHLPHTRYTHIKLKGNMKASELYAFKITTSLSIIWNIRPIMHLLTDKVNSLRTSARQNFHFKLARQALVECQRSLYLVSAFVEQYRVSVFTLSNPLQFSPVSLDGKMYTVYPSDLCTWSLGIHPGGEIYMTTSVS